MKSLQIILAFFLFNSFWFLIIGNKTIQELIIGILVSIPSLFLYLKIRKLIPFSIKVKLKSLSTFVKTLPIKLFNDVRILTLALIMRIKGKKLRGSFRTVPYDVTYGSRYYKIKNAGVTLSVSFLPNSISIGIDKHKKVMLIHYMILPNKKADELPL